MASICARSLRRSRTQRRRRLVWYIFSAGTQALGLRSGGMVMPYSQPWTEGDAWVKADEEPPPCLPPETSLHICPGWNSFNSKGLSRHNTLSHFAGPRRQGPIHAATERRCPTGNAQVIDSWCSTSPWLRVTAWGLSSLSFLPQATSMLVTILDALWPDAFSLFFTRRQVRSPRKIARPFPRSKESAAFVTAHSTASASARARARGYPQGPTPFS